MKCNVNVNVNLIYSCHALIALQALSLASLQACHFINKGNKYSNERNIVKNPNWQEADQLAIYKA